MVMIVSGNKSYSFGTFGLASSGSLTPSIFFGIPRSFGGNKVFVAACIGCCFT
jgi:hypothetical protein